MAEFRVDFVLDNRATGVDIRWRLPNRSAFTPLGVFSTSPAVIEVDDGVGPVRVNVRAVGADRRPVGRGTNLRADTGDGPDNRPDIVVTASLAPLMVQDGPTVTLIAQAPVGFDPLEYDVELRTSADIVTAPEDGLLLGFVDVGDSIDASTLAEETDIRVHHRLRRKDDGRTTGWSTLDEEISTGEIEGTETFSNDFASGSFPELLTSYEPMEISAGDIRLVGVSLDDMSLVALDEWADIALDDLKDLPTQGTFETPVFVLPAPEDLQFQVTADFTGTRLDFSLDDWGTLPHHWPDEVGGVFIDHRIRNMGRTLDGDRTPFQLEIKVATSTSTTPTFVDADFKEYQVGTARRRVRSYAMRIKVLSSYGSQFTIDKYFIRHWIFCKSRPWCHVSMASEIILDQTLTAAATVIETTTALVGDGISLLEFRIVWNGGGTGSNLFLYFNSTTSKKIPLTPSAWDISSGSEAITFTLDPRSGVERMAVIEHQIQYNSSGVKLNTRSDELEIFANTVDEIVSLHIWTEDTNGLGSGTRVTIAAKKDVLGT